MEFPKFVSVRPNLPLKADSLECQVSRLDGDLKKFKPKAAWSRNAKQAFAAQVKKTGRDLKGDSLLAQMSLAFDSGGEWHGLFISSRIKTFELHASLRKAFEDALKRREGETVRLTLTGLATADQKRVLQAFASLCVLSFWRADCYGKKSKDKIKPISKVEVAGDLPAEDFKEIVSESLNLAGANNLVRTLGLTPSNHLHPANYRAEIERRAKSRKYKMNFLNRAALTKMGAGAFLAVTQGSIEDEGGIVHLKYQPGTKKKKLVLVGKGLCFDTGGYNIKTGSYMYGMHKDMLGSAVALGIFETIAELKWDVEVHAFLALAENLISHKAYRPNDVVTALDGTTIEVVDTDAEGRMVLSDTLALASREKPDLLLDFATLTGSAIRALDTRRAALFSTSEELLKLGFDVGEECGERTWPLPMGEDYNEQLKSEIADLLQCSYGTNSDHCYAATFLSKFVGEKTPWLHLDLTPAGNKGGLGLVSSEITGFGVRWGFEVAKRYFGDDS